MSNEFATTRVLAHLILARPYGDPDDDLAVLSRQLLRADERIEAYEKALERLSRLGNEPEIGNSQGNLIAQETLAMWRATKS